MGRTICVEVPQEVGHAVRMDAEDLKRELAVHLYERGKLSFGKAREMAGMTIWAFQRLLAERNIPLHYDEADYEEDLETLRELGRL